MLAGMRDQLRVPEGTGEIPFPGLGKKLLEKSQDADLREQVKAGKCCTWCYDLPTENNPFKTGGYGQTGMQIHKKCHTSYVCVRKTSPSFSNCTSWVAAPLYVEYSLINYMGRAQVVHLDSGFCTYRIVVPLHWLCTHKGLGVHYIPPTSKEGGCDCRRLISEKGSHGWTGLANHEQRELVVVNALMDTQQGSARITCVLTCESVAITDSLALNNKMNFMNKFEIFIANTSAFFESKICRVI